MFCCELNLVFTTNFVQLTSKIANYFSLSNILNLDNFHY
jgi:hypothetical protein